MLVSIAHYVPYLCYFKGLHALGFEIHKGGTMLELVHLNITGLIKFLCILGLKSFYVSQSIQKTKKTYGPLVLL